MNDELANFALKIGLNTHEAYLDFELAEKNLKIWIVERGTGGCTFPQMELLAEMPLDDISLFPALAYSDTFLQKALATKTNIAIENPYFYETVFSS